MASARLRLCTSTLIGCEMMMQRRDLGIEYCIVGNDLTSGFYSRVITLHGNTIDVIFSTSLRTSLRKIIMRMY